MSIGQYPRGITMKFYNEEFLLPFWLKHHREMFDTGILINWHSTDNSVDICKELVPDWKIITPKGKTFSTVNGDEESTKAERLLGKMWKCSLNATEFFLCSNMDTLIQVATSNKYRVVYPARVAVLVDKPDSIGRTIDQDKSLILQCKEGIITPCRRKIAGLKDIKPYVYDGLKLDGDGNWTCVHHRVFHNHEHGRYTKGFHRSKHANHLIGSDYMIAWFLYAPWEQVRHRIYQWKGQKPESDLKKGWGTHHFRTPKQVDERFDDISWRMEDISRDRRYKDILLRWGKKYAQKK